MNRFWKSVLATIILASLCLAFIPGLYAQVGTITRRLIGTQDIYWATGGAGAAETYTYVDPSGNTLTLTKPDATHLKFRTSLWGTARSVDSIVARMHYEIWVGDPLYPTFAAAVATLNSAGTNCILRLPTGAHSVAANLTANSNIVLAPERGASIAIATGVTLTVSGSFEAGLYQAFACTGTGKVVLPAAVQKVPEWWGAVGDDSTDDKVALQAWATCGGNLNLPKKTYKTTAAITVAASSVIDGSGTIHQATDTVEGLICYSNVKVFNIGLTGAATAYGGPNYHVGIIPYSFRNGSGNNISTGALSLFAHGNDLIIDNVTFTAWDVAVWLGKDSIIRNCTATDNWREAFYAGGPGNRIILNEIDGCDSWAIDFNAGDSVASGNNIKNCGRVKADGGGIVFAGMTVEKPMTKLAAIWNTVDDCGVGHGIYVRSRDAAGDVKDVVIANNTLIGKSTGTSLTALTVYIGAANTTPMTNINIIGNTAKIWDTFIQAYYITGGNISNNTGHTFTPAANAAMPFGALNQVVIANNVAKGVAGVADTVMRIEGENNNNQFTGNIGEGAAVGFENQDSTGIGNNISDNDFSGCTLPINLPVALAAGNRLERNTGYVPGAALAPAVPASTVEVRNNKGYPVIVKVTGGTVTVISTGSVTGALTATGLTAGAVLLPPGWYISITHSSAPTWTWEGVQ
ncbi:MAG: hypothetical protein WC749_02080 [Dehalococcoidia bacterium]